MKTGQPNSLRDALLLAILVFIWIAIIIYTKYGVEEVSEKPSLDAQPSNEEMEFWSEVIKMLRFCVKPGSICKSLKEW